MLIGRETEIEMVMRMLDSARHGRSGCLVIRGGMGMGKTALLDHAAAASAGMTLIRVSGVETESEIAFAALHELVRPVLDRRGELPEPQRAAIEGALALDGHVPSDRFAIGAATLSLLALAGADGAVLVLVDDAQWIDSASSEALGFAVHRLDHEAVAVIIATSGTSPVAASRSSCLTIGALAPEPARQLLRLRAAVPVDPIVADRILDQSACCPLGIVSAAALLSPAQLAGRDALPTPLPIASSMVAQLLPAADGLSAGARQRLLSAAAADTRAIRVIGRAMGEGDPDTLAEAERLGMLVVSGHEVRFANQLLRSALYQAATPEERRTAHRAIAEALIEERYRDRRAIHLGKAATGPDEYAATELEWAADSYRARMGYGVAAAIYERAGELSVTDEDRCRRLYQAARCAWQAGQSAFADDLLDRASAGATDPLVVADLHHLRAAINIGRDRSSGSTASLAPEAERIATLDPARAARMLITESEAAPAADRLALLERARGLAVDGQDDVSLRVSLSLSATLRQLGRVSEAVAESDRAVVALERHPQLRDDPELLTLAAATSGERPPSLERCSQAVDAARRQGALALLPHALLLQARALEVTGSWGGALVALDEARLQFDASRQQWWIGAALAASARLEALRGRSEQCRGHLRSLEDVGWPDAERLPITETCLALLALAGGSAAEAAERFDRRLDMPDGPFALDVRRDLIPDAVEALSQIRRVDRARDLADADMAGAAPTTDWLQMRQLASAALVHENDAEALLGKSLEKAAALGTDHPYHRARVDLLYGRWLRRARRVRECRPPLRTAFEMFDSLGAAAWAELVAVELRATNEHPKPRDPSRRDELTPQEQRVAELLAQGLSYKEVAAHLFVSPKNVDYHAQKVYKKLGCKRGARDLAAKLADQEPVG
jgi:DNA-binding CsgD family transcriptional regulator